MIDLKSSVQWFSYGVVTLSNSQTKNDAKRIRQQGGQWGGRTHKVTQMNGHTQERERTHSVTKRTDTQGGCTQNVTQAIYLDSMLPKNHLVKIMQMTNYAWMNTSV